jgi:DNA polymerase-3 subunit alpha
LGWDAVGLTDHGWMGGAIPFYKAAKKAGIKPIIGCEMYVVGEDDLVDGDKEVLKERRHLTVLALSREGYENLVKWVTESMIRPAYYNGARISVERMVETAAHGLHHNVVFSGCLNGECCQCLLSGNGTGEMAAEMYLRSMVDAFPNFFVEVMNHEAERFMGQGFGSYEQMVANEAQARDKLLTLAQKLSIPVIVTNDSHYRSVQQRRPHLAMLARKQWRRGKEAHQEVTHNSTSDAFAAEYIYWTLYQRPMEPIAASLPAWAEKQSIESIRSIVEEADIRLDPLDSKGPSYTMPRSPYVDPVAEVRRRSMRRLKTMMARHGQAAIDRFDYELGAMEKFSHYLLIYSDIVAMARSQGILTWTRGSACASLVCYCLGIHQIDPIHYQLLFERFVNPARAKMPDVDIDIEAHRRDDVARMVREYMAELGQDIMAICTHSTLSNRNSFRLMAEAAGVPKERIDELARLLPQMIDSGMVGSEEEAYEQVREELGIDLHEDASAIFDTIGGVSQHACAFVIGTKERPLSSWIPTYLIGSSNALVTQYDMKAIEDLGYFKLDLLRLDTLSIMHSVARQLGHDLEWVESLGQSEPGIYDANAPATFERLCSGRTDGVFTFQGGTQRRGAIEVQPKTTDDLITIQALYRPGTTRSGIDKQYVRRRFDQEQWEHINAYTEKRWQDTLGLPFFQEQIMELGFDIGMTGEEVDDLYKAIKLAKGVGRGAQEAFEAFEPTFYDRALKVMPKEEADAIWAEFERYQGYSFNRAHACSFGVLGLKSAMLLEQHTLETYIALLENYPDNPRYVAAAIEDGYRFELPDVNASSVGFSKGSTKKSIRIGLVRVEGIGQGAAKAIVQNQPFGSIDDLTQRVGSRFIKQGEKVNTLQILAAVGALESLGVARETDDQTQFKLLDMVIGRPTAFEGCKPQVFARKGGTWKFLGLQRGLKLTLGKSFCAKMFWVPKGAEVLTKATSSGSYSADLLTVVDENGIPFDLQAGEHKDAERRLLKQLATMPGCVVCLEGQVGLPFLRGANSSFKVWGVSEAERSNPQVWHASMEDAKKIIQLAQIKRDQSRDSRRRDAE